MKTIDELLEAVAINLGKEQKPSDKKISAKQEMNRSHEGKNHSCEGKNRSCEGENHSCKGKNCSCAKSKAEPGEKYGLGLKTAKEIAYCVEKAAEKMGINVVISIVNDGANPILLNAMDNSYIISAKAAKEKAYTAMALKMPTHEALKASRGGALDGLTNGDGICLIPGGVPLEYEGRIYGALGVSGGSVDEDRLLAIIGSVYFGARMNYNMLHM